MLDSEWVMPGGFEQEVRDCLAHFYDYAFLQQHPLVQKLTPEITGPNRVQVFRQIATDVIEQLRPRNDVSLDSKMLRLYKILLLRYVNRLQIHNVMHQLAFSERQFYREHRKAVQALSRLLWERVTGIQAPESDDPEHVTISVHSEVQWVHSQAEQTPVELESLLRGAITATHNLAAQHAVRIELYDSDELSMFDADRTVLRQAIIWILSQMIAHVSAAGRVHISWEVLDHTCQISFELETQKANGPLLKAALEQQDTLRYLIQAVEGQTSSTQVSPGHFRLSLGIPLRRRTILLIDDNPGAINLFRRYLAGESCHLLVAREGEKAISLARKARPNVIVLDIMLPRQDGWEILQILKNHPVTQHIPVLVCSVLEVPDLAFSLGADGYLRKPPGQMGFLTTLAQHWG